MLDQIISTLKDQVGGDLSKKLGLDSGQVDGSVKAAGDSVQEVVGGGGDGMDLSSVLNLFSKQENGAGASALMGRLGQTFLGKLTGQVGLDAGKAGAVKDMVMPVLTRLLSEQIGGDKGKLASLLGGKADGLLGQAAGKLGGLGKMFGG